MDAAALRRRTQAALKLLFKLCFRTSTYRTAVVDEREEERVVRTQLLDKDKNTEYSVLVLVLS